MSESQITSLLIEEGKRLYNLKVPGITYAGDPNADALLSDIDHYPHAFVIACVADRQVKAETAWMLPHLLQERLGNFSIEALGVLTQEDFLHHMTAPTSLHRFTEIISNAIHSGVQRIIRQYNGDASQIWSGNPSSATVVYRFLEFEGMGPKIATMATNILARDFKVPLSDHYSIDISADVHIKRVFHRLGLVASDPTVEQVVYKARALHPDFPGIMDLPVWEIGRKWCHPHSPNCTDCLMQSVCPNSTT